MTLARRVKREDMAWRPEAKYFEDRLWWQQFDPRADIRFSYDRENKADEVWILFSTEAHAQRFEKIARDEWHVRVDAVDWSELPA